MAVLFTVLFVAYIWVCLLAYVATFLYGVLLVKLGKASGLFLILGLLVIPIVAVAFFIY